MNDEKYRAAIRAFADELWARLVTASFHHARGDRAAPEVIATSTTIIPPAPTTLTLEEYTRATEEGERLFYGHRKGTRDAQGPTG